MSIDASFKGVADFVSRNQDLIRDVAGTAKDAVGDIKTLADQLDQMRKDGADLIPRLNAQSFDLAGPALVRQQQQDILQQITQTQVKIERFIDRPELTTALYGDMAALYVQLSNTYNDTVRRFVEFTDDEMTELNSLLQRATLDAIARQRWAEVLAAAVSLTKAALKIAVKLAA